MDSKFVTPFVDSVKDFFGAMLQAEVRAETDGAQARPSTDLYDLAAMIGISGPARGNVTLSLGSETAVAIINRLLALELEEVDETVADGVAEMVNIIAGNAKARLGGGAAPLALGLPNVVRGEGYSVEYPSGTERVDLPFTSEFGPLLLRLTFARENRNG